MSLLDFSDTPKQAFMRGFWKGMAAPVILFGNFEAPKQKGARSVSIQIKSDAQALSGDWNKIGIDLNNAITKHGAKTNGTKRL